MGWFLVKNVHDYSGVTMLMKTQSDGTLRLVWIRDSGYTREGSGVSTSE